MPGRPLVLAGLVVFFLSARAHSGAPFAGPVGLAGRWALAEEASDNPVTSAEKPAASAGQGGRGGHGGSRGTSANRPVRVRNSS